MKIAVTGLELPEGKVKFPDTVVQDLADKFEPTKVSPYYFEFMPDDYVGADAIVIAHDRALDLLIQDMEKLENRLSRSEDPAEKSLIEKCLAHLDEERPLCDLAVDAAEEAILRALGPLSFKPTVLFEDIALDVGVVCRCVMEKAGMMFFYTAGKQEVHAWLVQNGADAVTCAGKIHSDLARGFIRAELVSYDDMMSVHNMQDARNKGVARLVRRDHSVPENTILEIHFNV